VVLEEELASFAARALTFAIAARAGCGLSFRAANFEVLVDRAQPGVKDGAWLSRKVHHARGQSSRRASSPAWPARRANLHEVSAFRDAALKPPTAGVAALPRYAEFPERACGARFTRCVGGERRLCVRYAAPRRGIPGFSFDPVSSHT
jgi:hypothetical protein